MRASLGALAFVVAFAATASAEPLKLNEASLEEVVGGLSVGGFGPIDIGVNNVIDVSNAIEAPVSVANNFDIDTNIGTALAINTNAVVAALSNNVRGVGNAAANIGLMPGAPGAQP